MSTAAATHEHMRRSAYRALDDPDRLARAARIVRAALATQRLTVTDLRRPVAAPVPDRRAVAA